MRRLINIVLHGSQFGRRTGWQHWPGFAMAHFCDGTSRFMGDISIDEVVAKLKTEAIDTKDYETRLAHWVKTGRALEEDPRI